MSVLLPFIVRSRVKGKFFVVVESGQKKWSEEHEVLPVIEMAMKEEISSGKAHKMTDNEVR